MNSKSQVSLPKHIAVIMDGNGRWAKKRHLPRSMGHRAGAKAVRDLVENCARKGIQILTVFAFSSENWSRPQKEVDELMELFFSNLEKELPKLQKNNIRLRVIGDRTRLTSELQQRVAAVEDVTQDNTHMTLVLAISYGGRWDITQAVKKLFEQIQNNQLTINTITEQTISQYLCLSDLSEPDLLIRTSGEQRISNFLLWQLAYTELYFTSKYWPDFDAEELDLALQYFSERQRRFGLTDEQLSEGTEA